MGLGFATLIPRGRERCDGDRERPRDQAVRNDLRRWTAELAGRCSWSASHRGLRARRLDGKRERARRSCRTSSSGSAAPRPDGRRPACRQHRPHDPRRRVGVARRPRRRRSAGRSTRADTGVIVNGDDVDAYGLAVEHFQKFEVIWNGRNGEDVFFQNEMPYDPPSQSAWMSSPTTDGYAAFLVTPRARTSRATGWGATRSSTRACRSSPPRRSSRRPSGVQFTDLLTIFLNKIGVSGGILGDQRGRRLVDGGESRHPGRSCSSYP